MDMPDIFTKEKRSEIMSLIKSKNTKPELALRKLVSSRLYPLGYRYRIHYKSIMGRPDIVFVSLKLAIFIDGTFWHGFDFENRKHKLPQTYWLEKIQKNIERDKKVNKNLKKAGWKVLRIWEHELKKRPEKVMKMIEGLVLKIAQSENPSQTVKKGYNKHMPKAYILKHKDGSIWMKGQKSGDEMDGYWEWFRKDGTKMRSGFFNRGIQTGKWVTYDSRGKEVKVTMMSELPKISAPAERAFAQAKIKTLKELSKYTEKQILELHGVGPSAIPQLRKALKTKALTFKK